jgi:hypothetical protein
MIRMCAITFRRILAAMATLFWLGSPSPATAVDEFPESKDCKPIPYCVTYKKGEAGQFAGRCIRWGHILPCVPTPAPAPEKSSGSEVVPKPPTGFNPNKSYDTVHKPTAQEKGAILSPSEKPSQESRPPGGTGNFLKKMQP